jgi:hypothetical protein
MRTKISHWMKKILCLLAAAIVMAGCSNRYDITLGNGLAFKGVSKPVLNKETGEYSFTDATGRIMKVKDSRVRVIEPHSKTDEGAKFRNVAPR